MISTDRAVFNPTSAVSARLANLAKRVGNLQIIVLSRPWRIKSFSKPDLITCQDPFLTGLLGFCLAKIMSVPLELQLHTDFLTPAFRQFNFKNKIYYWLAKKLLPQANQVRVVSEKLKNSLTKGNLVLNDKIYILPIFISKTESIEPAWRDLIPKEAKVILSVGRLEAEKRLSLALESFALLTDKDIYLVIIGSGSELSDLKKLSQKLGLAGRVIWAGKLNLSEVGGSYKVAKVLLHTSAYEGYGLVFVEAALAGLPIVSTDVGVAREAGAIIAPAEPAALAVALNQQLTNPILPTVGRLAISEEEYLSGLVGWWEKLIKLS